VLFGGTAAKLCRWDDTHTFGGQAHGFVATFWVREIRRYFPSHYCHHHLNEQEHQIQRATDAAGEPLHGYGTASVAVSVEPGLHVQIDDACDAYVPKPFSSEWLSAPEFPPVLREIFGRKRCIAPNYAVCSATFVPGTHPVSTRVGLYQFRRNFSNNAFIFSAQN